MLGNGVLSGAEYVFEINQAIPGAMTVYAEATDNDGLKTRSDYLTIEVHGAFTSEISHIRKEVSQQGIVIFPNPVAFQKICYQLEGNQSLPALFEIFDIEGRMVYNQNLEKSAGTLDIGYLPAGLYIVKCVTDDVINTTKLIVK